MKERLPVYYTGEGYSQARLLVCHTISVDCLWWVGWASIEEDDHSGNVLTWWNSEAWRNSKHPTAFMKVRSAEPGHSQLWLLSEHRLQYKGWLGKESQDVRELLTQSHKTSLLLLPDGCVKTKTSSEDGCGSEVLGGGLGGLLLSEAALCSFF